MLFCEKAKAKRLAADIAVAASAAATAADTIRRPNIHHSGKITLGGGCRLPLQGEPMERDRLPRTTQTRPE
jgi:hypothetical protein